MTVSANFAAAGSSWPRKQGWSLRWDRIPTVLVRSTKKSLWASEDFPAWVNDVAARMDKVVALEDGWDRANGKSTSIPAIEMALVVLADTMANDSIPPQIIPTTDGGLQLEWHCAGVDLEVYVEADGSVSAWCREGSREWEEDFYPRARLTKELSLLTDVYCR